MAWGHRDLDFHPCPAFLMYQVVDFDVQSRCNPNLMIVQCCIDQSLCKQFAKQNKTKDHTDRHGWAELQAHYPSLYSMMQIRLVRAPGPGLFHVSASVGLEEEVGPGALLCW